MDNIQKRKIAIIILVILLSILYRIQYIQPHHPDHYTLAQYINTLMELGYAPWVLHISSLFGYYPMSVPSGFQFFSAFLSLITGQELDILFFYISVLFGLLGGAGIFLLMRKWKSFEISLTVAFVLLTMTFFALDTSNTASSRIFNIIFYPLFLVLLFDIYEKWDLGLYNRIKYISTASIVLLFMAIVHRLAQLSLILLGSFVISLVIVKRKALLEKLQSTRVYSKRQEMYQVSNLYTISDIVFICILFFGFFFIKAKIVYMVLAIAMSMYLYFFGSIKDRSQLWIFFDIFIYITFFAVAKLFDLVYRGRLSHHLKNLVPDITFSLLYVIFIYFAILVLFGLFYFIYSLVIKKYKSKMLRLIDVLETRINTTFIVIKRDSDYTISVALFLILILLGILVFVSGGLFHLDKSYYEKSFILEGKNSIIIFLNFLFNLNNNLTILIFFSIIGVVYVFLFSQKDIYTYFFMLTAIFFSQLVFDWEYVRLFMNPIYAIFIGLGLFLAINKCLNLKSAKIKLICTLALVAIVTGHFIISNVFIHRDYIFNRIGIQENMDKIAEDYYIGAGDYLQKDYEYSVWASSNYIRVGKIAYYSKLPEAVVASNIYIDKNNFEVVRSTWGEVLDDVLAGNKVRQIYRIKDWLFGSYFYYGRHIFYLDNNRFSDKYSEKIVEQYKIRFIADGKESIDKSNFFEAVSPYKSKIYSNPELQIYDLNNGI